MNHAQGTLIKCKVICNFMLTLNY